MSWLLLLLLFQSTTTHISLSPAIDWFWRQEERNHLKQLFALCGWHQLLACHGLFKDFLELQILKELGIRWGYATKKWIFAGGMGSRSPGFGTTEWFLKTHCCRCWSMVRGVRQMEGTGVVHPSLLNVPKEFGERVGSMQCSREWGQGKRWWIRDWRIGQFWWPPIVTIYSCTKQCLLQLLHFSSCPLITTSCFQWSIMIRLWLLLL